MRRCWYCHKDLDVTQQEWAKHMLKEHYDQPTVQSHTARYTSIADGEEA